MLGIKSNSNSPSAVIATPDVLQLHNCQLVDSAVISSSVFIVSPFNLNNGVRVPAQDASLDFMYIEKSADTPALTIVLITFMGNGLLTVVVFHVNPNDGAVVLYVPESDSPGKDIQ